MRKLISIHICLVLVFLLFWSIFDLPWSVIYVFDFLLCMEFAWCVRSIQPVLRRTKALTLIPFFACFVCYLLLIQICNFVSPIAAVMAYRRIFRFYLFFFACAVLLTEENIDKIMGLLVKMQIPNLILTLYQFFVQGLVQDELGGIFGTERGANAYSNIFLCIVCTYMIVGYLDKKVRFWPMLLTFGSAMMVSALAELKIMFVEIIIIVIAAILLSKASVRTIKTIMFSVAGFVGGMILLAKLFPEHVAILLNLGLFYEYTSGKLPGYSISRLNAFSEINQIFFKGNILRNLFGYGFGGCESGTEFYEKYSGYQYSRFTHQVTLLETGYIGLMFYVGFFVLIYFYAGKSKKVNPEKSLYYMISQIISVLCVIWMVYDQSLRVEAGYLVFFMLAIPIAIRNNWVKSRYKNGISS